MLAIVERPDFKMHASSRVARSDVKKLASRTMGSQLRVLSGEISRKRDAKKNLNCTLDSRWLLDVMGLEMVE